MSIRTSDDTVLWRAGSLAESLAASLHELRTTALASQALILYRPRGHVLRVVAADALDRAVFLPDEPVHLNIPWVSRPLSVDHVSIVSAMRPVGVDLSQAVLIPFSNGSGNGIIALGAASSISAAACELARDVALEIERLRTHENKVRHADVDRAYRLVARAASADLSVERVFDVTLAAARYLLDSQVAYLSTPVDDENFCFTRTMGIKTDPFRNLRVGYGEGLGGAARALERPVRSLNYDDDSSLRAAMREETRGEGIYSAVAAPIKDQDDVEAVIYVASREPHAYSEHDEKVLADFSGVALLGLDRAVLEEHRASTIRTQERLRIARKLHDDLVRKLTQIGVAAAQLEGAGDDQGPLLHSSSAHLAEISANVNDCMSLIRDELQGLVSGVDNAPWTLGLVGERILEVPSLTRMQRRLTFEGQPAVGADRGSVARRPIQPDIAEVMCSIGQESVFNAENHSLGTTCIIDISATPENWVLSVADDGTIAADFSGAEGHFGVDFMKREARNVGGRVDFLSNDLGGVTVRATFPRGRECR